MTPLLDRVEYTLRQRVSAGSLKYRLHDGLDLQGQHLLFFLIDHSWVSPLRILQAVLGVSHGLGVGLLGGDAGGLLAGLGDDLVGAHHGGNDGGEIDQLVGEGPGWWGKHPSTGDTRG